MWEEKNAGYCWSLSDAADSPPSTRPGGTSPTYTLSSCLFYLLLLSLRCHATIPALTPPHPFSSLALPISPPPLPPYSLTDIRPPVSLSATSAPINSKPFLPSNSAPDASRSIPNNAPHRLQLRSGVMGLVRAVSVVLGVVLGAGAVL
ncbi:hypothetical protein C8J57DRAFT_1508302 [Mycena rebaudengoi]|nr:hypothetical protein C8J57DRAFT_1508302 [Mycena rebaudengoi]